MSVQGQSLGWHPIGPSENNSSPQLTLRLQCFCFDEHPKCLDMALGSHCFVGKGKYTKPRNTTYPNTFSISKSRNSLAEEGGWARKLVSLKGGAPCQQIMRVRIQPGLLSYV